MKQYDVILRTNGQRPYLEYLTRVACNPNMTVQGIPPFENYLEAEKYARTAIYCVVDDDVIPASKESLLNLAWQLDCHSELGILGLAYNPHLDAEKLQGWILGEAITADILNVDHVGGIFAIRKGILTDEGERPDFDKGLGDDMILCRQLRRKGYKVGLLISDCFFHIGEKHSTIWENSVDE